MQKYSPISDGEPNMREDSAHGTYYWCEDVDARDAETFMTMRKDRQRIADLESALRSATFALIKKRAADAQWSQTVDAAVAEANAALGSPTS